MIAYDTVTEAVNGLKERGFVMDFNLEENCLVCQNDKFNTMILRSWNTTGLKAIQILPMRR